MAIGIGFHRWENDVMETKVVHCKKEKYDILIDRRTLFGNPYILVKDGERDEVIQQFEDWLRGKRDISWKQDIRKEILRRLPELKGKILGCWCKPLSCHGDVYIKLEKENYTNSD